MTAIGTKRTFVAPQPFGRYWTNSGQTRILARDGLSANDPKRTLASRASTNTLSLGQFRDVEMPAT